MLAIRVARIFDGRDLLPGAGVVFVDGDRIVGVEPARVDIPGDCEVLDRPAGTLLPGLIDAHVHLVADSRPAALDRLPEFSDDDLTRTIEESLRIQLATGVTTVRDLGDTRWSVLDWRTPSRRRTADSGGLRAADHQPWRTLLEHGRRSLGSG